MARISQEMVRMRDGVSLNSFIFLPDGDGPWPTIVQRSPYSISQTGATDLRDPATAWLPDPGLPLSGAILRGWQAIVSQGYAAVYQDCRGRYGSEGEDRLYADDAADGADTIDWICAQPWSDGTIGLAGSSAAATTALAAASSGHPAVRCFFAQVGAANIYDDFFYDGGSIELERLLLWISKHSGGLSESHRQSLARNLDLSAVEVDRLIGEAGEVHDRLSLSVRGDIPFAGNGAWAGHALFDYPILSTVQPFFNDIVSHPVSDDFRRSHDYNDSIACPGFHISSWYDVFLKATLRSFQRLQDRVGNQRLWIGPNGHYAVYDDRFWPRDPFFEWFGVWLKGIDAPVMRDPPILACTKSWLDDLADLKSRDWMALSHWPPERSRAATLYLCGDGRIDPAPGGGIRLLTADPLNPTITAGGRNMLIPPGPAGRNASDQGDDGQLRYRSASLRSPITIAGRVRIDLSVSCDAPDADFCAKLFEITADGEERVICDGAQRMMLAASTGASRRLHDGGIHGVEIDLGDTFHRFAAGSRIGVGLAGSSFPQRLINCHDGQLDLSRAEPRTGRIATSKLYHDAPHVAALHLDILGDAPPIDDLFKKAVPDD